MADDAKADETKAKAAAEGLKAILDVLAPAPAPADEPPPSPATPVDELYGAIGAADVSSSAQAAMTAVARYRSATRWLIGAVAAVGLALFGSVAFTDGDPLSGWRWAGLLLAAVGLAVILLAATLVFEPEDASLGELVADFDKVDRGSWRKYHPRWIAIAQLKAILEGSEKQAHLGAGLEKVQDLITRIGEQETARVEPAKAVARARRVLADRTTRREVAEKRLDALVKARAAATGLQGPPAGELDAAIARAARSVRGELTAEARAHASLTRALRELAEVDVPLGVDMLHRSVILDESAVAQVRGTFRLSRPVLLIGAMAALVGSLVYLTDVKEDPAQAVVRAGSLRVAENTSSADELLPVCVGVDLRVLLFAAATPATGTELEVTITDPQACRGSVTFPAGWVAGDITLVPTPAVKVPEPPAEEGEEGSG